MSTIWINDAGDEINEEDHFLNTTNSDDQERERNKLRKLGYIKTVTK